MKKGISAAIAESRTVIIADDDDSAKKDGRPDDA